MRAANSTSSNWPSTGPPSATTSPSPCLERPEIQRIAALHDGPSILHEWANLTTAISARVAALSVVLLAAASIDPDAKDLRERTQTQRHLGAQALVDHLANHADLAPPMDKHTAADLIWLYSDPLIYHRLVHERQWSPPQFQAWLEAAATGQLIDRPVSDRHRRRPSGSPAARRC